MHFNPASSSSSSSSMLFAQSQAHDEPRLYSWNHSDTAAEIEKLGYPDIAEKCRELEIHGQRFINVEHATIMKMFRCSENIAKSIVERFRNIRNEELKRLPRTSKQALTKIETSRKTGNLALNDMKLSTFPGLICDIFNLSNISATKNEIKEVPAEIGLLTALQSLKLGKNRLIALPLSIGSLTNLQVLSLEENKLKEIPSQIENCGSLRTIDVSHNNLRRLPSVLHKCNKLTKLNIVANPLNIPAELISRGIKTIFKVLEAVHIAEGDFTLTLHDVVFQSLPEFALEMHFLRVLDLQQNRLQDVMRICEMTNLETLILKYNLIERVPLELGDLKNLTNLDIRGNPLLSPPKDLADLSTQSILRYLNMKRMLWFENLDHVYSQLDEDNSGKINSKEFFDGLRTISLKGLNGEELKSYAQQHWKVDIMTKQTFYDIMENFLRQSASHRMYELDWSNIGMPSFSLDLNVPEVIETLVLDSNAISDLPQEFTHLCSLRILRLRRNRLTELPPALLALTALEELYVEENSIQTVAGVVSLRRLKVLAADGNQLKSLPNNIFMIDSLRRLSIVNNPLQMPLKRIAQEDIEYVKTYLRIFHEAEVSGTLDLNSMDFRDLPFEAELQNVVTVNLSGNRFHKFPEQLELATNLVHLEIENNYLEEFASFLFYSLTNLTLLSVQKNRIQRIPRKISRLKLLKELRVSQNEIDSIPYTMSLLNNLKVLDVSSNHLPAFDVVLADIPQLEVLNFAKNSVTELPADISKMTNLRELYVQGNQIKTIPDVFDRLHLRRLDLDKNALVQVPLSIGALKTSLEDIKVDKFLHLEDPPDAIVVRGTGPLLDYLHRQYKAVSSQELDLSSLNLGKVSAPLRVLHKRSGGLRAINLSNNHLTAIPRDIGMLSSLETFVVRDNQLSALPPSSKEMVCLTHLDMAGNEFGAVPEILTFTPHIRFLDMSRNKISSLYRDIDDMTESLTDTIRTTQRAGDQNLDNGSKSRLRNVVDTKVRGQVLLSLKSRNRSKKIAALFQLTNLEILYMRYNQVSLLPGSISKFTNLRELDCAHNCLVDTPPDIRVLRHLKRIDFSHNCLRGIPPDIGNLKEVEFLDLSYNQLQELPREVGYMISLKSLDFSNNQIVFLPVELEALETSLTVLSAENNAITDPPNEILKQGRDSVFTYFRRVRNGQRSRDLVLIDMHLTVLNINWWNLTVLTALEISGNHVQELPSTIRLLSNLVLLKAPGNDLKRIIQDDDLSCFPSLSRLALKDNKIAAIDRHIADLVNLKELDMSANTIDVITPDIEKCSKLKRFKISQNNIHQLPKGIFRIAGLNQFLASSNSISRLPNTICYCVSLKEVDLSFNRLEILPADLGNLQNLERLDLASNLLSTLPSSIKRFEKLEYLNINSNQLTTIPPEIKKLKSLIELHLKDNLLLSVPPEIGSLSQLAILSLDGNQFMSIPTTVMKLESLRHFSVNLEQTLALQTVEGPMLASMEVVELSQDKANLRKIPIEQMMTGTQAMSKYFDRVHQRISIPSLNLTHMQLVSIPQEVFTFTSLTVLDLKANQIDFLPADIAALTALTQLDLSENSLTQVHESVGSLSNLTWLGLGRNKVSEMPRALDHLKKLNYVDLHVNNIRSLTADDDGNEGASRGILDLKGLRDFECSYNVLEELPDLSSWFSLTRINVSHNQLRELPDMIFRLFTLEKLESGDNRLRSISPSISKLTCLTLLSLKNNNLRLLPRELGRCIALKSLSLNANDIIALPDEICLLDRLRRLTVSANHIVELPWHMGRLVSLQRVDLSSNPLRFLPPSLGALEALESLDIFECEDLIDPPESIASRGLRETMRYLSRVWSGFENQKMNLTGMEMGKLVLELSHPHLASLSQLQLDKNNLCFLPESIQHLVNLRSLRFRDNLISKLPQSFSALTSLREVDMSKNRFTNIPKVLMELTSLARLRCGHNPIPYSISSSWIEDDVQKFLTNYTYETIGKRISAMWNNNNRAEVFRAWMMLVQDEWTGED